MSGHSKWATTKHKKAAIDAKRGKLFAKLIKNIEVAARLGGGDPAGNPTLYAAIQKAQKSSVPNNNIDNAIKRGTDHLLSGKQALVIGYGDVGKGSAQSLRQEGMIVKVSEVDPICAMQACMDGFELAELIESCIGPAFAAQGFASTDILASWSEIVGERLAQACQPEKLEWSRRRGAATRASWRRCARWPAPSPPRSSPSASSGPGCWRCRCSRDRRPTRSARRGAGPWASAGASWKRAPSTARWRSRRWWAW